jgi:hypothetical protein
MILVIRLLLLLFPYLVIGEKYDEQMDGLFKFYDVVTNFFHSVQLFSNMPGPVGPVLKII